MSDGSRHSMAYVKESTYGVTPSNPVFKPIRGGRTTLGLSKDSLQSEEIRDDRQIADHRHGTYQVGGEVPFELSFGSFDDFIEAALCGTWTADVLKAGVERNSFTIERLFADLAPADKPYHRYTGVELNTMSLKIAPNGIVTGSFGVIGKGYNTATGILTGATYDSETTTSPFDSFTGTINEGGSPVAVVTELSINIENGIEPRFVVGSKETIRPNIGRSKVTGEITAYFENSTLIDKYINETESNIDFTLADAAGNQYVITIPRIKYNDGRPDVNGEGPVFLTMPFQALLDDTEQSNIKVERIAA